MTPRKRLKRGYALQARLAAAVALVTSPLALGQTTFDTIGVTALLNQDPTLTGSGIRIAQVEANDSLVTNTYEFEANPSYTGQPASFFTYIQPDGSVSTTFNSSQESGHADLAGEILYGTASDNAGAPGMVPGISHVDGYSGDYFSNTLVPQGLPISDAIVNLDFSVVPSLTIAQAVTVQQASDTAFDNYIDEYGKIMVLAMSNSTTPNYPIPPATDYNGISVASLDAAGSMGPTIDNGRSKPDIAAPGSLTSFTIPLVSGSAAILVQAGARGDGGNTPQLESEAVDFRTVKALLLNGADKTSAAFVRTPDAPLDPNNGAGVLNIYNSYMQLAAGQQSPSSTTITGSVGGAHAPVVSGTALPLLNGWSFGTITSSATHDVYANYLFQPTAGTNGYSFTATLDWARPFNPNTAAPIGINTFGLYLYDTTSNLLLDWSNSAVDNVQDVFDNNLLPGHLYDLEVLKNGGAGEISDSETYGIAFSNSANADGTFELTGVWKNGAGGIWADPANWYGGIIPEHGGQTVNFTDTAEAPTTVTLDFAWSVGNINFLNSNSYTLAVNSSGGGYLAMYSGSQTSQITDSGGSHFITAPVALYSSLEVTVANNGDNLSITGNISGAEPLTLSGQGTLTLGGSNSYSGGTTLISGTLIAAAQGALPAYSSVTVGNGVRTANLRLSSGTGTTVISSLQINAGSLVDIGNNAIAINYGAIYNDPIFDVVTNLLSGYNGGAWTGTAGIISTAAQNTAGPLLSVGYTDGAADSNAGAVPNQVLIKYTLAGDANLDGLVNFADLVAVVQNFQRFGTDWAHGNFLYADSTSFADLVIVIQNFNKVLPGGESMNAPMQTVRLVSGTDVQLPEPGFAGAAFVCAGALLAKKKRPGIRKVNGVRG